MLTRSLMSVSDEVLKQDLLVAVEREREATAELLLFLGEFEARRLYVPAAFSSMQEYCVEVLRLSEDAAKKRLQVARVARRFPLVLDAVADGRLHLSAVVMLATRLTPENVEALVAAASDRSRAQLEGVLAEWFPRADVPASVREVPLVLPVAPEATSDISAPGHSMSPLAAPSMPARVAPLSPGRHEVRFTFSDAQREKLRLAQCLLGRAVPSGALDQVFERCLDALIEHEEKPTLAASSRSRPRPGATAGRHVPAAVRREVMARDGRQCTFVSAAGRRCSACRRLDFDHVVPLAKGGQTTAANLRLLCPVHNQHAADRVYGAGFMAEKRAASRARREERVESRAASTRDMSAPGHSMSSPPSRAHIDEVVPVLMALEYRRQEAREGAELCAGMAGESLEARVKVALRGLMRARFVRGTAQASTAG